MSRLSRSSRRSAGGLPEFARLAATTGLGTALQYYSYSLYGLAAALIFPELFFPGLGPVAGTVASFATFAVGFVIRPLGGFIFGIMGDRLGRKAVLVTTLLLIGISSALIGFVPSAASIGAAAPILLVACRLAQGLGFGAEVAGAMVVAAESAPKRLRGLYATLPQIGVAVGGLGATAAWTVARTTTGAEFVTWGWRVPFVGSLLVVVVGLVIRLRMKETPVFRELRAAGTTSRHPFRTVLRTHRRSLAVALGARFADNGLAYVYQTFALAYAADYLAARTPGLEDTLVVGLAVAAAVSVVALPAFGALSDRVGRRPVFLAGAVFSMLWAFPFFDIISRDQVPPWLAILALVVALGIGKPMSTAPQIAYLTELFDASVRSTGLTVARELPAIVGGWIPLIATVLVARAGGAYWPAALLVVGFCGVAAVALLFGPETRQRDMDVDEFLGSGQANSGIASPR